MKCCVECFADDEIKAIIASYARRGSCDICGAEDAFVYEIGSDTILSDAFDTMLDAFIPLSSLPGDYPQERADLLKNVLRYEWRVLEGDSSQAYRLLKAVCARRYSDQPELFREPVVVLHMDDEDYLRQNEILRNHSWEGFVTELKHRNRFHTQCVNIDMLKTFIECVREVHRKGEVLFRARNCSTPKGYRRSEMGAPPCDRATAGRVNPEGISVLYLSDSHETTFCETRSAVYDYVAVGRFVLQKDMAMINLAALDKISPLVGIDRGFDIGQYAVNIEHLRKITSEIAKPLRRQDSALDYLPTQYISDYIRSQGYDGIEFASTMRQGGVNYAIFDETLFKCTKTYVYEIESVLHNYRKLS